VSELTLEEKLAGAANSARLETAEKHFFDLAQPFHPLGFSICHRNPGHWDVHATRAPGKASAFKAVNPNGRTSETDHEEERAFRIRGEPGKVLVFDERWDPHRPHPRPVMTFRSVMGAVMWIAEELIQEPTR